MINKMSKQKTHIEMISELYDHFLAPKPIPENMTGEEICKLYGKSKVWFDKLRAKSKPIKDLGYKKLYDRRYSYDSKEIINVLKKLGYEIKK